MRGRKSYNEAVIEYWSLVGMSEIREPSEKKNVTSPIGTQTRQRVPYPYTLIPGGDSCNSLKGPLYPWLWHTTDLRWMSKKSMGAEMSLVRNAEIHLLEGVYLSRVKAQTSPDPFPNTCFSECIGIVGLLLVKNIKHNHNHDLESLKTYTCAGSGLANTFLLEHKLRSGYTPVCVIKWVFLILILAEHASRFPSENFSHSLQLYTFKNIYISFIH